MMENHTTETVAQPEHADAAAHHGGHGPYWQDPTFWVAIAFVLVVAMLWKTVARILAQALADRASSIQARIAEAQKLRDETAALVKEYQRKLADAHEEADAIITQAKEDASRLRRDAHQALEASMSKREQQALDRIAQAERQASDEVRDLAVNIAINAASDVLRDHMAGAAGARMIDRSMASLGSDLKRGVN